MLGTATTVVDMSNSSHRLIGNLRKVREAVSTSGSSAAPSTSNEQSQAPVDVAGNERIYALGACLKLLMDAPEDLWRSMERERLLAAAWTFVLARVVWRDLMDRPVEDLQAPDIKVRSGHYSRTESQAIRSFATS